MKHAPQAMALLRRLAFFIKGRFLSAIFVVGLGLSCASAQVSDTLYLDLEACMARALSEDLRLARGQLNVDEATANRTQSYLSLLPSVNANSSFSMNWGRSIDPTTNDFISQTTRFINLGGNAQLPLFAGLQRWNSIRQARLNQAVARYGLEAARQEVQLNVLTLYLDVLLADENLQQRQSIRENALRSLQRGRRQWEAGAIPAGDTLSLRAELATRDTDIITADNRLRLAILRLKQSLRIPFETPLGVRSADTDELLAEMAGPMTQSAFADLYQQALLVQPAIKQAEQRSASARIGLSLARANIYPSLNLSGGFQSNYSSFADRARFNIQSVKEIVPIGYLASDPSQIVLSQISVPQATQISDSYGISDQIKDNLNYSMRLGLNIPIFNRWQTRNQIQRAKVGMYRARLGVVSAQDALRQDMELAYQEARAAEKRWNAARESLRATRESLRATEISYLNGQSDFINYQITQNQYYQSESEALRAKYTYIFRQKVLDFYQGNWAY